MGDMADMNIENGLMVEAELDEALDESDEEIIESIEFTLQDKSYRKDRFTDKVKGIVEYWHKHKHITAKQRFCLKEHLKNNHGIWYGNI
jgi:hypothetical protein